MLPWCRISPLCSYVKIVHQGLRQIKYAEANVHGTVEVQSRFLHVHRSQLICENSGVVEGGEGGESLQLFHIIHKFN